MQANSKQITADERLKIRIRRFNTIVKAFFVLFTALVFIIFYLVNNDILNRIYLFTLLIPFFFFLILRHFFKSHSFTKKLKLRDEIREYADKFFFVRVIYDDKAVFNAIAILIAIVIVAATVSTIV